MYSKQHTMKLLAQAFSARLHFTLPLLENAEEPTGFPLDLGSVGLTCEGRAYRLDTASSSLIVEDGKVVVSSKLVLDFETFPNITNDKDFGEAYDLNMADLSNPNIKAEVYVNEDTDQDDSVMDFDKFEGTITIWIDNKEFEIPCTLE